ncbi:hypothetical protein ACJMK2_023943 [Sinanodonta woodiana]|uniref:Uncharacterized protein n=1 Tax=Sinanodonta woodiana TaxID=1069815 RepID=A0ABD3T6S5_SINWO
MAACLAKKAASFLTSIATGSKADKADANLTVQFAKEVKDFSSQYGEENHESYTARNLAGNDRIFSSCGDFYQACAFRTYGPWWKMAPSARKTFEGTPETFISDDYIEITFATKVYPVKLAIYETDYPGAIVHILACEMIGTDVDTGIDM